LEGFSLRQRIRYRIDRLVAKSAVWQVLMLALVAAALMIIGAVAVSDCDPENLGREEDASWAYRLWWAAIRVIDPGNFAGDFTDEIVAVTGVTISLAGILIFSLLIGILSSKLTEKMDLMKRGKSPVVERDHTVIVGTGDKLFDVVREIVEANENQRDRAIAVFSPVPKQDMEEAMGERVGDFKGTRMAYRTGRTSDLDALRMLNLGAARSLVVLGDSDPANVKVLMAARSLMSERRQGRISAVCEIRDQRMGRIAELSFPGVRWVPVGEVITRLVVQVCRHPGLSRVYSELLSFQGNEIYFGKKPGMHGRSFGQMALCTTQSVVLGIGREGDIMLNPPPDTRLEKGDELIVLMLDDDRFRPDLDLEVEPVELCGACRSPEAGRESILILSGDRRRLTLMVRLLGSYVGRGSSAVIAGSLDPDDAEGLVSEIGETENLSVSYRRISRSDPRDLEELEPFGYDSVIVTSTQSEDDETSDTDCITTLLILKRIRSSLPNPPQTTVVSEIRNPRNRRLANTAEIDDFVVSNEVTSMVMAQLAEETRLWGVYREIFDPRGSEIYLRPASWICPHRDSATFRELVRCGLARREIVMGCIDHTREDGGSLRLNPAPETVVDLTEGCQLVTLAKG
jgi:Trk K+ transport system NAD-binding subunit